MVAVNSPMLTLAAAKPYVELWLLMLVRPWAVWGRRNPLLAESSSGPGSTAGKELLWQHLPCSSLCLWLAEPLYPCAESKPALTTSSGPPCAGGWLDVVLAGAELCWPGQLLIRSSVSPQHQQQAQPEHPCMCCWPPVCGPCGGLPRPQPCRESPAGKMACHRTLPSAPASGFHLTVIRRYNPISSEEGSASDTLEKQAPAVFQSNEGNKYRKDYIKWTNVWNNLIAIRNFYSYTVVIE